MANIIPGRLRGFLREHLSDDHVNKIMQILAPFMQMTEQDAFAYSAEVNAIDFRLSICIEALTGITCSDIACTKIDSGLLPVYIGDGLRADLLNMNPKDNPAEQLSQQVREDLTFALLHSFLKALCETTNKQTDIGRFRRPSDDLWWIIHTWIASELVNDPLRADRSHALEQLVVQASKGWIPLGVQKNRETNVLVLGGARTCYIPLPFAP